MSLLHVTFLFGSRKQHLVDALNRAFEGLANVGAVVAYPLTAIEELDAMYTTVTTAEYLGVHVKPYEAIVVESQRDRPIPPLLVVGGLLEKGDDPFSVAAATETAGAVLSAVATHNTASTNPIKRLGLLAEDFMRDQIHVDEGSRAIARVFLDKMLRGFAKE